MGKNFKVWHTANAGLYIQTEHAKILLDSLYQKDNLFSPMSESMEQQLFTEGELLSAADCLLFTHGHYDHYDYQSVTKYMRERKEQIKLAAPECVFSVAGWNREDFLHSEKFQVFTNNQNGGFCFNDTEIFYYRTPHLEFDFSHFGFHYSFAIRKKEDAIFILGDAPLNAETERRIKEQGKLKAAFFNPIVLHKKESRERIRQFEIEHIFIYHLPLEKDDRYYYRKAAIHMLSKYKDELPNVRLLLEEMEEVL